MNYSGIAQWFTTTTVPLSNALSFALGNVTLSSKFTAAFDAFMIEKVTVRFYPPYQQTGTMSVSTSASSTNQPQLILSTVVDYDDSTAIALGDAQTRPSYNSVVMTDGVKPYHEVSIVPALAMAAYQGAFTAYAQRQRQWVDTAYPNTVHYGLKYLIQPQYADGVVGNASNQFGVQGCLYYEVAMQVAFKQQL